MTILRHFSHLFPCVLQTELCPYVLASVGCLTDANDATGYGVFASIEVSCFIISAGECAGGWRCS